jgi:hypothetical protein
MSGIHCQRCGRFIPEGALRYQVAVKVRSSFDGVIPDSPSVGTPEDGESELERLLLEADAYTEEELNRQVYEDDVLIMCPSCKEAFMEDIYSHLITRANPKLNRAHLVH